MSWSTTTCARLPIDLTDNNEMQELICRAMDSYGYEELASQYRIYLNINPGSATQSGVRFKLSGVRRDCSGSH